MTQWSDILNFNSKHSRSLQKTFNQVPLVITNGFNNSKIKDEHKAFLNITSMLIQSFFPPINLNEVKYYWKKIEVDKCKRILLFNLNIEGSDPIIEFRHYSIDIEKNSIKKTVHLLVK